MRSDVTSLKLQYDNCLAQHQQMCEVVCSTLEREMRRHGIRLHSIKSRVKTFESFYNKTKIKNYSDPFSKCEDIAGCRIVCLFKDQIDKISDVIADNFQVIKKDKKKRKADQFSYSAHHFIVKLKPEEGQPALKTVCEIQVRTILQDAWAEIEHYVNYKHIGVDEEILRKVNALCALFEIAEDQFYAIHEEFKEVSDNTAIVQKQKMNPVLLYHYCKATFPWAWQADYENLDNLDEYAAIVEQYMHKGITTIDQLHQLLAKHKHRIDADEQLRVKEVLNNPITWPKLYRRVKATGHFYSPMIILAKLINEYHK